MKNLILLSLVLLVASCATLPKPETPRQMLASTSSSIVDMANAIGLAESSNKISKNTENKLLDELEKALDNMRLANVALTIYETTGEGEEDVDRKILQIEAVLLLVEQMLRESQE